MPSLAAARTLHEKFNFRVQIDGIDKLFFQKASELSQEVAQIDYYEGGALIPIKWPGRVTISDVTLDRGVGVDVDLHNWMFQVADPAKAGGIGAGLPPALYSRNISILQNDRTKTQIIRRWKLFGAWPKKYVAGEWDNTVDEVVIEMLTLAIDRFELASALSAGRFNVAVGP